MSTVHIGVFYTDYVLSKFEPNSKLYPLFALTCLIIAAKYDELDQNIPPYDAFIRASGMNVPRQTITEFEMKLLGQLDWSLRVVTPGTFVQLFLTQGVIFTTDKSNKVGINEALTKKMTRQANVLLDSALEYHELLEFPQSVIASACIALSRKLFALTPIWPAQMSLMTGHEYDTISKCVDKLSNYYHNAGLGIITTKKETTTTSKPVLGVRNNFLNTIYQTSVVTGRSKPTNEEKKTCVIEIQQPPSQKTSKLGSRPRSRVILRVVEDAAKAGGFAKNGTTALYVSVNKSMAVGFDPVNTYSNQSVAQTKKPGKLAAIRESSIGVKTATNAAKRATKENASIIASRHKPRASENMVRKSEIPSRQKKSSMLPAIVHKNLRA